MVQLFSVPAYFIVLRETLEASVILSVMLTLLDRLIEDPCMRRRLKRHVWMGTITGAGISLAAATIFLSLYYTVAKKAWNNTEALWEGILGLVAVVLITVMAFSMLRAEKWRVKWEGKLEKVTLDALKEQDDHPDGETDGWYKSKKSKYALFLVPLTVVVREGVEAVIFLGGIGLEGSGWAYPIPAVAGALCGIAIGYLLYKGGGHLALKYLMMAATTLLLIIAAGVFSGSVYAFEEYYHSMNHVWNLKCCDPEGKGIWPLLNAVVGWRNEGTRGTISAYVAYWVFVAATFFFLRQKWEREDSSLESSERTTQKSSESTAHESPAMIKHNAIEMTTPEASV